MRQGELSCGKPTFPSILSDRWDWPDSCLKRGAKEIFDESFKIFLLLSLGSPNVSQKLFPCLLLYISQRKQSRQIATVKGELSDFGNLIFCVWLREMHEVGIINWILVRVSCPLFHISDSSATNYTMGIFFLRISGKATKTIKHCQRHNGPRVLTL